MAKIELNTISTKSFGIAFMVLFFSLGFLLIWTFYERGNVNDIVFDSLNEIYKNSRPFESRISRFEYAPNKKTANYSVSQIDIVKLNEIEAILSKNTSINPNVENLHSLGRLYLTRKELFKAIEELTKAKKINAKKAQIQNDLGVAYLEASELLRKSENGKSLEYLGKALDEFDEAISIDPNTIEAYFNQAITLQKLDLQNQSKLAWQEYINKDSTSHWALEAKKNLEEIESNKISNRTPERLVKDFLKAYHNDNDETAYKIVSDNREMIKSKLIPQELVFLFLETEKSEYLSALKYIGKLEIEKTGESYFRGIASYYSTVSKGKYSKLLDAQKAVKSGYKSSLEGDYKKSREKFANARKIFLELNNKWEAGLSDYWIAYCDAQIDKLQESSERLEDLLEYCQKNKFKWLAAHTIYWLSINSFNTKEISESIEYARDSLKFSEETNDFYNTQKSLSWLADLYLQVNQIQKTYFYLQRSLEMSKRTNSSSRQRARNFDKAARLFYTAKIYKPAIDFEKEMLDLYAAEDISFEHIGLANLSNIYSAQGKYKDALEFAEQGKKISESLSEEKSREKAVGYATLQIADLQRRKGSCENALNNYEKAINIFGAMELKSLVFKSMKGRFLCNLKSKNNKAIDKELPNLLRLFEENRENIIEEQNRISFFDKEQSIYDLAIDYEISKGNSERAFDYSEVSRSRSLLD